MDDQFAYVPAAFAPAYFGTALTDQRTGGNRHYSVPNTHTSCMWPEGQLTCRLLDAGARLEPLRVSFRIMAHARLNGGDPPPQTGPRPTPHVCAGRAASLPAVVGQWSTDDVVLWLRQVRPLALAL